MCGTVNSCDLKFLHRTVSMTQNGTPNPRFCPSKHLKQRSFCSIIMQGGEGSQVRVGVRIRPLTPKETSEGGKVVVDGNAFHRTVELGKRKFTYDSVFHSTVSQSDLYSNVAPPLLDSFLNGFNATILAYGQTG